MRTPPEPLGAGDTVYQEIIRLERERIDAYDRRDIDILADGFAEEYLHTNLHGGTTTKAARFLPCGGILTRER